MTVATNMRRQFYDGNGVTTEFAVPFQFFEIDVFVEGFLQTDGIDFTIAGGDGGTGSVTFVVPPASGSNDVAIVGNTARGQSTDLTDNGPFPADAVEQMSDRLSMIAQELDVAIELSVRVPTSDPSLPTISFDTNRGFVLWSNPFTGAPELAPVDTVLGSSVSDAATSAAAAALSETNAQSSASAAASAAQAAAATFDQFDDRYLGAFATDPVTDNDGDPLAAGALYTNTALNVMRIYNGSMWLTAFSDAFTSDDIQNVSFVIGDDVSDALETLDAGLRAVPINEETTNYTLQTTDAGGIVEMNSGSANTLTVPPNASVDLPIGTRIDVVQIGAGQTSLVAGAGVTIESRDNELSIADQFTAASLYKRASDTWVAVGNLTS